MKNKRREFLKLAGISAAGATILPACNSGAGGDSMPGSSDAGGNATANKDWQADPEWLETRYGAWGGPGVSDGPGPMDGVLVKDHAPRSSLVVEETFVPKAKYPVIDVHLHDYPERAEDKNPEEALEEWVRTQEEVGIETSVILTGATGSDFDRLVEMYLEPYPEQFQLYCGVETAGIDEPDYPERAVAELERCYSKGARGVGEISDKGYGITRDTELAPDDRLHHDDARLDPLWEKCAELDLPVNVHIADHPSSWEAPDVFQERTPVFQQFNQHDADGLPYEELLDVLPRLLEKHSETTFIACHLANQGNDLGRLSKLLDQYSNLYLDISARDYEVGRQPRTAARFLAEYSDRVLFGTDMGMKKTMYQSWWRLLESADEYMEGRVGWRYYGLELSESVLEALYRNNARRIMNWEAVKA